MKEDILKFVSSKQLKPVDLSAKVPAITEGPEPTAPKAPGAPSGTTDLGTLKGGDEIVVRISTFTKTMAKTMTIARVSGKLLKITKLFKYVLASENICYDEIAIIFVYTRAPISL